MDLTKLIIIGWQKFMSALGNIAAAQSAKRTGLKIAPKTRPINELNNELFIRFRKIQNKCAQILAKTCANIHNFIS